MTDFIPWNSQSLEEWAGKYAPGKFINLEGHFTHYIEKGEGEPVILLHGFGSDSYSWHKNIDALATKFRIYALDLWGCGYSTREPLNYGYPLYTQQLLSFMDALNIERACLIGQSMGGGTIIKFTTEHRDRVKSIILVCAGGMPYKPLLTQRIMALPGLGEFVLSLPTDLFRRLFIKRIYLYRKEVTPEYFNGLTWSQKVKGSNETYLKILRLKFFHTLSNEIHYLSKMGVPTLIVWGRHDKGIPVRLGEEMHHILKDSRIEIFENSGHEPHDEEPEKFNQVVIDFLAKH